MNETLEKLTKPLNEFWAKMDKKNRWMLVIFAGVVLVVAIALVALMSRREYEVLYSGLQPSDAGEVVKKLDELNEPYQTGDGGTVMVTTGKANTLRMQLAYEGLPKSNLSYDIFTNSQSFGNTDDDRQKFWTIQMQERLSATIKALDKVTDAIVNITLPRVGTTVLRGEETPSQASVIITLQPGAELDIKQIRAIEDLMLTSVPSLARDNLSIIDSHMNSYRSQDGEGSVEGIGTRYELEQRVRDGLRKQIEALFEPVYGIGNVRALVNASMDFDATKTESIRFEPVTDAGEGIAISLNEIRENATNTPIAQVPGQDPNGANVIYPQVGAVNGTYTRTSQTVNYEVNQIKTLVDGAPGALTSLSVSLLINQPEMPDNIREQITNLVATAVGVDTNVITVTGMEFSETIRLQELLNERIAMDRDMQNWTKTFNLIIIFTIIGLLIAIAMTLVVIQLRKRRAIEREAEDLLLREMQAQAASEAQQATKIDLEHKNEYMTQINEFIYKNPESVAHLLRNWISEDEL